MPGLLSKPAVIALRTYASLVVGGCRVVTGNLIYEWALCPLCALAVQKRPLCDSGRHRDNFRPQTQKRSAAHCMYDQVGGRMRSWDRDGAN